VAGQMRIHPTECRQPAHQSIQPKLGITHVCISILHHVLPTKLGTFLSQGIALMQAHHTRRGPLPSSTKFTYGPPCDAQDEHMQPTSRVAHQKIQSKPTLPHERMRTSNPFDCDEDGWPLSQPTLRLISAHNVASWLQTTLTNHSNLCSIALVRHL